MMHSLGDVTLAGAVVVCVLLTLSQQTAKAAERQQAAESAQTRSGKHQIQTAAMGAVNKRRRRSVDSNPFQQLVDALQSDDMTNADLYMHYTPSTPSPQDINCYVEVPTVLREGGRCVRLGRGRARDGRYPSRMWACQAGVHLAFSSHCEHRAQAARAGRG